MGGSASCSSPRPSPRLCAVPRGGCWLAPCASPVGCQICGICGLLMFPMLSPTLVAGCFRLVLPPVEKQNCRICSVGFLSNNSTAKGSGQNILCFKYLSLGMNPGIPQQPSWKLTTDLWPPAQLDPCCQVKFQIHLEFHVTLIGIVLPWVSLGSTVADAVVSWGTMVALGATWPVHPRCCAAWLDTGTVFCSSGDPPGTLAVRKATKNSHPLFQSIS